MSGKSELKINSKFAEKYDKYRQREELQRLKDRYGDQDEGDSSDSDSDEDSEVELDPKLDKDFYRTLSLLKKRDPKIYQPDATFYTEPVEACGGDVQPSTSAAAVKVKPMFLKDYERKVILERGGKYDDEEEEDEESDEEEAARRRERAASPSYMQEQRELKESFRQFVHNSDDDDDEKEEKDQLLTKRTKTQKEKDQEEEDYVEWLKGQAELDGPEEVQDMKFLRDYWNDPELDEKERFLRDFVLNKKYLEEQDHGIPTYDEVVQDDVEDSEEEGESFLLRQEDFERQYNFRFEEPDAQKIKTYPRTIATSVRSKDERRKTKREEVKERKIKEKQQKQAGLKQLKNLKRGQILDKLRRLRELTGNQEAAFAEDDLDGDFNPQQHDTLMQKLFGDDYYGNEEEEKPQFDDEEMEEHWNWDTWTGDRPEDEPAQGGEDGEEGEDDPAGEGGEDGAGGQPDCDDPDFIMDADYDPSQPSGSKRKRRKEKKRMTKDDAQLTGKRRKRSHFAEVITKDKPVFDPQEKSFEQYLDEYYGLDYEDIIDDLPCRFRYRPVLANDFGLTTDEILGADEKDLNRWCSLKKTCMFRSDREEQCDLKNFQIKARNEAKKKEILSSFYSEEGQKKKRERQKKRGEEEAGPSRDAPAPDPALDPPAPGRAQPGPPEEEEEEFLVPKNKEEEEKEEKSSPAVEETTDVAKKKMMKKNNKLPRRKLRHPGGRLISRPFRVKMGGREFSGQRLKAYGLDPKRLHFRQLGRQKRKAQEKRDKQKSKEAA